MTWAVIRPLFTYFANKFSRDLGDKVKRGIERKKEIGKYFGGRPYKKIDAEQIKHLRMTGLSFRAIANEINKSLPGKERISYGTVKNVLNKPSLNSMYGKQLN